MKAILMSIYIFGACAFAASAQTKTAEITMDPAPGYGKYMEVQPLSVTPSKKHKKLEIERGSPRINPDSNKQDMIVANGKRKFVRKEGKLAVTPAGIEEEKTK